MITILRERKYKINEILLKSNKTRKLFFKILSYKENLYEESNLVDYAYNQLYKAGLFDKDSDYNGDLGKAVIDLITLFSSQGHSGYSADYVRLIFNRLSNFKPINAIENPLTTQEFTDTSDLYSDGTGGHYQSNILFNMFSDDYGKSWFLNLPIPKKDKNGNTFTDYKKVIVKKFPFYYEDYYSEG